VSDGLDRLPEGWDDLVRADAEALGPPEKAKDRVRRRLEVTLGITALAAAAAGVGSTATAATTAGAATATVAGAAVVTSVKVAVGLIALSAVTGTAYVGLRERSERAHRAKPPPVVQPSIPAARPSPVNAVPLPDPLAEEEQLLTGARSALTRGALEEASRELELHRARFGQGRLSEEREALEIRLLVRRGNIAEARRRATGFRAAHPTSLQLHVIDEALGGEP
jgi:hypothetical protein